VVEIPGIDVREREMGTVFFAATMVAPRGGVTASKRLCAAAAAPSRG
jgi:hypothetical protein